jgi:glucosyl-3-phosphoglycerate synthase
VSVALLAGSGRDTLAAHARVLLDELTNGSPLLDDVRLICGEDKEMVAAASAAGLRTLVVPGGSPAQPGRLMHASLLALESDIVVWVDADIRNPHAKIIYGLVGPLVQNERLQYVKGFYGLPREAPDADLQNLVGELAARPLLNLFFAELSGLIDPLGSEHAIRRRAALRLPIFTGSSAQLALLIDVFDHFSLSAIGQVGLEERIARPIDLAEATRRAFSAVQVLTSRLGIGSDHAVHERATPTIKLIHQTDDSFRVTAIDAREAELLP